MWHPTKEKFGLQTMSTKLGLPPCDAPMATTPLCLCVIVCVCVRVRRGVAQSATRNAHHNCDSKRLAYRYAVCTATRGFSLNSLCCRLYRRSCAFCFVKGFPKFAVKPASYLTAEAYITRHHKRETCVKHYKALRVTSPCIHWQHRPGHRHKHGSVSWSYL
jgi:hypothetical protein